MVDLFLEFVLVDEAVDPKGAEKVVIPIADAARGDFLPQGEWSAEGPGWRCPERS